MKRSKGWLALIVIVVVTALVVGLNVVRKGGSKAKAASRVEIQIGLCGDPAAIAGALDLRSRGAPLEVWLFDDAELAMLQRGLRFRLRVTDDRSELTMKVANQDCTALAPGVVPKKEGKCEYDMHGDAVTGAVSLSRALDATQTRAIREARLALVDALSSSQVKYLRDVVGVWPLPGDVHRLGPIQVQRYRGADLPYDVDVSTLPDGSRFVEISRKVAAAKVAHARERLNADLAQAGVAACDDQSAQAQTKLRALLAGSPG